MTTLSIKEVQLERALVCYNEVWNGWPELDASNVDECRKAAMTAALATLSQPTADRREIVARVKADPGDGTLHPDLAHVLARGFDTMGWDRPASAAEDTIDAIIAALDGGRDA